MLTCWSFDVDETLEVSGGPITLQQLIDLKDNDNIVGLCGNWAMVTMQVKNWHHLFSFLNAGCNNKVEFLKNLKQYVPADRYVHVGNILGVSGSSDDKGSAEKAGWDFLSETEFANGMR